MSGIETINTVATFLWSCVGIIGAIILLWAFWQLIQIVRNLREYGLDYIGFHRGELYHIARKHKITILKPSQKRNVHSILWEEKFDKHEEEVRK